MQKLFLLIMLSVIIIPSVLQGEFIKTRKEDTVKIKITSNDITLIGKLNNSITSQDFIKKLPITLTFKVHQNREYYSNIKLAKNNDIKNGYKIGDISYWVDGNTLVFFYGSGNTNNLIKMGDIIEGLENLSHMENVFSAKITIYN